MEIVIVGAGPAGITACYNVLRRNKNIKVYLIEKNERLGGLAKSSVYRERFIFDTGPKRFHTEDREVVEFIYNIGKYINMIKIDRISKVFFWNKFFRWPLERSNIVKLPLDIVFRSVKDLIFRKSFSPQDMLKFENYIISHYGRILYEEFFRPYTEKFLHINVEHIHSDWASTGINRTIIHKEYKGNSLVELVHQVLLPSKVETKFLYPGKGGFGSFWDACVSMIEKNEDLVIERNTTVKRIVCKKDKLLLILSNGKEIEGNYVFWSGKLPDLVEGIGDRKIDYYLPYIDTIFIDLVFDRGSTINKDAFCQWLYVPSPKYKVSRISFPKQFNKNNIPDDYEGVCAEITIKENERDLDHGAMVQLVFEELLDMGIFKGNATICHSNVHRECATYPVYHAKYKNEVERVFRKIWIFSKQIIPFGRSGSFWYNNMDHTVKQSLSLTNDLLDGRCPGFNFRKYFGGIKNK